MRLSTSTLAMTAGVLFAATAAIDIPHTQPDEFTGSLDYALEVLFSLSMAASTAAAWALLRDAGSRVARVGWTAVGIGYALLTVVTAATAASGGNVLGPVFGLALLAIGIGSVTLTAGDVAGRVAPRGAGIVTLVGLVSMVALGEGYGLLGWSAAWFAVGALLRLRTQLPSTSRDLTRASSAS
jgi:hypothetical protein